MLQLQWEKFPVPIGHVSGDRSTKDLRRILNIRECAKATFLFVKNGIAFLKDKL